MSQLHLYIGMICGGGLGTFLIYREWPLVVLFGGFAVLNSATEFLIG